MRGDDANKGSLFSYSDLEKRVSAERPLRLIREIANAALKSLSRDFDALYSPIGRESIPPERLARALLLQAFCAIGSERQLVERIDTDLLFRWFVGLGIGDPVWDADTFAKNRDRLLDGEGAQKFRAALLAHDKVKTRSRACCRASISRSTGRCWKPGPARRASARRTARAPPGPGPQQPAPAQAGGERDFHRERRRKDTHASTIDPDARLFRKGAGKEARLCCMGHAPMENRHGLIVDAATTRASGHAERLAAIALIEPRADRPRPITPGADKACDTGDFAIELREPVEGPATTSPSASASASKRLSAGPRRWPACARCVIAACPSSAGNPPW